MYIITLLYDRFYLTDSILNKMKLSVCLVSVFMSKNSLCLQLTPEATVTEKLTVESQNKKHMFPILW